MRLVRVMVVGLSGTCGACTFSASPAAPDLFLCEAARNVVQAPVRDHDQVHFFKVVRKEAERAWEHVCKASGQRPSEAYHNGFVEGFVDYVEAGGMGEPPYLPPFRYRLTHSRTPEGLARIEDWYAGFREGSAVAKASGLRELNNIPLPGPPIPKKLGWVDSGLPAPALPRLPGERSPWEQPGDLPMPRPVPPEPIPFMPEPRLPIPPMPDPRPIPPLVPGVLDIPMAAVPAPAQPSTAAPSVQTAEGPGNVEAASWRPASLPAVLRNAIPGPGPY